MERAREGREGLDPINHVMLSGVVATGIQDHPMFDDLPPITVLIDFDIRSRDVVIRARQSVIIPDALTDAERDLLTPGTSLLLVGELLGAGEVEVKALVPGRRVERELQTYAARR